MTKKSLIIFLYVTSLIFNHNIHAENQNTTNIQNETDKISISNDTKTDKERNYQDKIKGCSYGIVLPYYIQSQKTEASTESTNTILNNINATKYSDFIRNNDKLNNAASKFCECLINNSNLNSKKSINPVTLNTIIEIQGDLCMKHSKLDIVLNTMNQTQK